MNYAPQRRKPQFKQNIREDPKIKLDKQRRSFSNQNRRKKTENLQDCQRSQKNRVGEVGEVGCVTTRRRNRNAKPNRRTLTANTIKREDDRDENWIACRGEVLEQIGGLWTSRNCRRK